MKKLLSVVLCFLTVVSVVTASDFKALYDDTHGQTAGNADWIISGAYSEFAETIENNGFKIDNLSEAAENKVFSTELLSDYSALILAEPNNPYSKEESHAIVEFVRNGGGVFIIGDHGNADRNGNGWDAVKIFNTFCENFGFKFAGDMLYEAPISGKINSEHPVMSGVRSVGAWAGSTFELVDAADAKAVGLIDSRFKKAPYIVAAEAGKGRVVAIGDSSPFDDGKGSDNKSKLHDSYDSFMFNHPQLAYNAMTWVTGKNPSKRVPSRKVPFYNEARAEEKNINILIDAAHGNSSSDKMKTFQKHMEANGLKVYYSLNLIKPEILKNFNVLMIPDPSLKLLDTESKAIVEWLMNGGNLVMGCAWDSSRSRGTRTLNYILKNLGSVMKYNDDQVWDHKNKTNKPWGVISTRMKQGHPVTRNVKQVITWGTCSLIDRNDKPLTDEAGVEILVMASKDAFNKDGNKKYPAVIYPKNVPIPIMATEEIANGRLVLIGCCNFTDYQYPDSEINQSLGGETPFTHETPILYDNLMKYLTNKK